VCSILTESLMEIDMGAVTNESSYTIINMDTYTLNNSKLYSMYIYKITDYTGDASFVTTVDVSNSIDLNFQIGWNYIVNPYEEEYTINNLLGELDPDNTYTIGVVNNDFASAIMIRTPHLTANGNGDDEHWLNFAEIADLVVSPYEGYYISFSDISANSVPGPVLNPLPPLPNNSPPG
jgi:hypothetical protein